MGTQQSGHDTTDGATEGNSPHRFLQRQVKTVNGRLGHTSKDAAHCNGQCFGFDCLVPCLDGDTQRSAAFCHVGQQHTGAEQGIKTSFRQQLDHGSSQGHVHTGHDHVGEQSRKQSNRDGACNVIQPQDRGGEMDKRYGLVYVNKHNDGTGDLARYKKDSFGWYAQKIREECYE